VSGAVDVTAPKLTAASSRKVHGTAGTFDLPLNLTGTATIEPRIGGPNTIVFTFDEPIVADDVTIDADEFSLDHATFNSASVTGSTLTLVLANVVNGKYLHVGLVGLSDVAGNALATTSLTVGALYGDVTRSGAVNAADIAIVKAGSGQTVGATNFLWDVNASGAINAADIGIVKNLSGASIDAASLLLAGIGN